MTTTALASSISRLQHLAVGVTLALSGVAWAAPVTPGQPLAPIVTTDQHDRTLRTEPTTRTLLFAADKKASDLVTEVLQPFGADALTARQAVFIADIHAMPALITRMFALPALRQMPFAIGLVRDAALTADLPRNKDQVTLIALRDGVVQQISYATNAAELQQALVLPAR
jgi:hypothetical protein